MASSGLHSNGYSLTRHVFFALAGWSLDRRVDELGSTLGEELLVPTKVYSLDCLALIDAVEVHAFSHVTGGGLAANLDRVLPDGISIDIDRTSWSPAPIFGLIGQLGGVAQPELERTLNMGVGMVAIVAAPDADRALRVLTDRGVAAWVVGTAQASAGSPGRTTLIGEYRS
jgi:phosphoribosylformylglycinamidine cyclo-ligase